MRGSEWCAAALFTAALLAAVVSVIDYMTKARL